MMSVLEGGDGCTSGGRSERSRESGDLLPEDARERNGEGGLTCMLAVAIIRVLCCEQRFGVVSRCSRCREMADSARVLYLDVAAAWIVLVPVSAPLS
jgi:hypothetical protein